MHIVLTDCFAISSCGFIEPVYKGQPSYVMWFVMWSWLEKEFLPFDLNEYEYMGRQTSDPRSGLDCAFPLTQSRYSRASAGSVHQLHLLRFYLIVKVNLNVHTASFSLVHHLTTYRAFIQHTVIIQMFVVIIVILYSLNLSNIWIVVLLKEKIRNHF